MENKEFTELLHTLLMPLSEANSDSDNVSSLKELFENRLQELELSQNQVEKLLNIERKSLVGILDRTAKRVDVINILKLGSFLNLNTEEFLKIYLTEMPSEMIGDLEQARKSNFIVSYFDLSSLYKSKFLSSKNDFNYIENRLKRFFNLDNIFDYNAQKVFPAFSRTKKASNNLMREFWVKSAYVHFEVINNPNSYDRDALIDLIPKIRPYTINIDNGLMIVCQALYNVGVTVIYQPYLPTVQVRGATFLVNRKPCIVLTDLNKNYPTIWFALMHELHHVLYDLEAIERNVYHITGEPDLLLVNEDKANEFAREYLFSAERSKYISQLINDELLVWEYAKQSQVHPSFIYNFYNYDQHNQGYSNAWSKFKQFFPDVKQAIKNLNTNPWEKETIEESVEQIKETVFNLK
jgi:Zn-dependent peptidase ImmA (M78 family)